MRYNKIIIFFALLVFFFFTYQGALSHIIFYHEQHVLFLWTQAYFEKIMASEGFIQYLTNFVVQFFYVPWLGSLIVSLLLSLIFLFSLYILRNIIGVKDFLLLSVIPTFILFLYTTKAENSLSLVVLVFVSLLIISLLLAIIRRFTSVFPLVKCKEKEVYRKKIFYFLPLIFFVVYGAITYGYFIKKYNTSERLMLKIEQFAKNEDWPKVLDYTSRYLDSGRTNQLVAYFHNLALFYNETLLDDLLDYPQVLGVEGLFFAWKSDSRESEYGHYIYEKLGYLNEAQRWKFEAMVVWGETAPHLINLAEYNIVMGKPKVAQKFINVLKQSLFYKEKALELEQGIVSDELQSSYNAYIGEVRDVRFSNILNLGKELEYLTEINPNNKMAFEYFMSYLLLSNNVVRFANNFHKIKNFNYTKVPRIFEEALLIYKLGVSEQEFNALGYTLSAETEKRFSVYHSLVQYNQRRQLEQDFGNSYWFYLNNISPYGNKVIVN